MLLTDRSESLERKNTGTPSLFRGTPSLFRGTPSLWIFFLFTTISGFSQELLPVSIHMEHSAHFAAYGEQPPSFYDSLHSFRNITVAVDRDCQLKKTVFGYHPYWMGSAYLNYQWNLLSDLCYFSYEVNPATGNAVTIHNWLTDPAIDLALQHGVKVHLCVTLFSGHASFFSNPVAKQTLISNLISLLQQRNAHGINIDFEAVPSAQGDNLTAFISELSLQLEADLPEALLSIAIPAVNWGNTFRINDLAPFIDLFIVMGYDYYWNGSATAGPVAPLYSLAASYDYSLSRSISAYQAEGITGEKFILGVPYYGRQWLTQSNAIPSPVLANGTALTYANIRNNGGGNYSPQNYHWEPNSFASCYVFFQNSNWSQCFIGLDRDARKWYDIVNYRQLAGIGIWALGYDNGYVELWQAISDKFSDCYVPLTYDTLYDSGGPAWNYYTGEHYVMAVDHGWQQPRYLDFIQFHLEDPFDSIWVYAGPDTLSPLLGGFTGLSNPGSFASPTGSFTLKFRSDPVQHRPGWMAVYHDGALGGASMPIPEEQPSLIFPNPSPGNVYLKSKPGIIFHEFVIHDNTGKVVRQVRPDHVGQPLEYHSLDLSQMAAGIYYVVISGSPDYQQSFKMIKK